MSCGNGRRAIIILAGLLLIASVMVDYGGLAVLAQSTSSTVSPTTSTVARSTSAPTGAPTTPAGIEGCVSDYNSSANVDYFPEKAEIKYAQTFAVTYESSYKVLNINGIVYILYQCDTPKPELRNMTVQEYISVPVTRVATGTTDHIPRIELLGHRDSIVAYTADTSLIGSPCVDALVTDETIVEATSNINCTSSGFTFEASIADNEALVELGVEVAFGDNLLTSYCDNASMREKAVAVVSYLETGPNAGLAEAEVIKLFSLFYNEEAKGNEVFEEIEYLWDCTKNNAQGCSLRLEDTPEVAWFPFFDSTGDAKWSTPRPDVYYSYAINNTGGVMIECPQPADNVFDMMTDEEMVACFSNATVCVFATDYNEVELMVEEEVLNNLTCVQNDRVYDITLSGFNAWFEAKSVEPHVYMEDLVVALHGEGFNYGIGSYERLLLRYVAEEESESGSYYPDVGTCDDPDAALEIQGQCEVIIDFNTCDESADESANEAAYESAYESPAARVLPSLVGISALTLAAAATFIFAVIVDANLP